jgi:hypothetical protein
MAKDFKNKKRALNEWIGSRQIVVIPNRLTLQSRDADHKPGQGEKQATDPLLVQIGRNPCP